MNKSGQKSMIRPVGIVAFAFVAAMLVLCFYWAAPWIIKQGIERTGTELNGARVDVANVDLSLSPAGLYIYGLQITDAKQPMQNMLELEQAYAELDLFELWGGKVLINDLNIQSLRFGTDRTVSGAVQNEDLVAETEGESPSSVSESLSGSFASLGGELPDADSLLERHPLKTTELAKQLDSTFEEQKTKWQATSQALPDEKRLEYYEQEFKALTSGDIDSLEAFNERKAKFDALKQELEKDQELLLKAKQDLQQSQDLVQQNYQALKRAPQEDLKALKAQYSLDADGGLNLTGLLFGSQFQSYAENALYWYNRLAPLMAKTDSSSEDGSAADAQQDAVEPARGNGRFVHFGAKATSPDFLIQKAQASAVFSQGEVVFLGQDITHQQYLTGKASVISANATELNDTDLIDMVLTIDHRTADTADSLSLDIKGQRLGDLILSESDSLSLALADAKLDGNANVLLKSEDLSGELKSRFKNTKLVADGSSQVAKELASAFERVNSFSLNSELSGTLSQPEFDVKSDLDKVLKEAIAGRFEEKQKEWEGKLKAKLDSKLSSYLEENAQVTKYFGDQSALLEGDLDSVDSLLNSQLDSYVDAQADEIKDKASNALKDKLKGLF